MIFPNIEDYVVVFDNIMPDELCETILNEYSDSKDWVESSIGLGTTDREKRNVDGIAISHPSIMDKNLEVRKKIDYDVFLCAAAAIRKYNLIFPLASIEQDSGYDLLRYQEGQFYVQHIDSFKGIPRTVSCSFSLNEDYDGGEFAFWDREKKYKLNKGSAIMFPSNFLYPHEIMPVLRGSRYSIVTWFI